MSSIVVLSPSSSATGLGWGPPAGNGAELQLASTPFLAPERAGLKLVLQILRGLEQCGFEGIVLGFGVQGRAGNPLRRVACMPGRLGMQARSRNLQPNLNAEGRLGRPLVFEDDFGSGDHSQLMQVLELRIHLALSGGLPVETQIVKGGFHIRSGLGVGLHAVHGVGTCRVTA
jgi:hypothetical protein